VSVVDVIKARITGTTTGLFAHAPYPLENSLEYQGDPGLFGPDSVTWRVIGDVATFVGGIRALLVQAAHQEVAAGVADHSRYKDDPLGRLSRTSAYVTATAFGAMPEVQQAIRIVRRAHRPVRGESHRLQTYAADDPGHAAWVHNALTDSFLVAHQRYGKDKLDERDADRFVAEQTAVGRLLDASPLPRTGDVLADWVENHPDIGVSPGMIHAVDFVRKPPLPLVVRAPYRILYWAAVATIPVSLRVVIGVRRVPGAIALGKLMVRFLRWALGSSPSWYIALKRVDADLPEGYRFRTHPFR
jgi:uncharacterized protein (DUF2236 family)